MTNLFPTLTGPDTTRLIKSARLQSNAIREQIAQKLSSSAVTSTVTRLAGELTAADGGLISSLVNVQKASGGAGRVRMAGEELTFDRNSGARHNGDKSESL